jgi:hypothetical protein
MSDNRFNINMPSMPDIPVDRMLASRQNLRGNILPMSGRKSYALLAIAGILLITMLVTFGIISYNDYNIFKSLTFVTDVKLGRTGESTECKDQTEFIPGTEYTYAEAEDGSGKWRQCQRVWEESSISGECMTLDDYKTFFDSSKRNVEFIGAASLILGLLFIFLGGKSINMHPVAEIFVIFGLFGTTIALGSVLINRINKLKSEYDDEKLYAETTPDKLYGCVKIKELNRIKWATQISTAVSFVAFLISFVISSGSQTASQTF